MQNPIKKILGTRYYTINNRPPLAAEINNNMKQEKILILGTLLASLFTANAATELSLHHMATEFPLQREEKPLLSFAFHSGWASKYISEGVDAFGEGGIWEFNPEIHMGDFTFSSWYGISDSINAAELKLIGSYDFKWNHFTFTPSYEHSFAYPGAEDGDTPAFGLTYEIPETGITIGADIQWAVNSGTWRGYYDTFVEKSWELTDNLIVSTSVLYAFNDGYLGEEVGHGSNTLDYSLECEYQFYHGCSFRCSFNYSQALTVLKQAERRNESKFGDEFWVGTYLQI